MDDRKQRSISRFLSLVLRHRPGLIGVQPDPAGWVPVEELLQGLRREHRGIDREQLETVVALNDKQRFQFNETRTHLRATQGHSIPVDLGYDQAVPPAWLCHGTPSRFVESIRREGLRKQQRHHVHLHQDEALAQQVGARRGESVVLRIASGKMTESGYAFFVTPNAVWLTDHVPAEFIIFPD